MAWRGVGLLGLLLEAWLYTWGRETAGYYLSPVLLLCAGLAASLCIYHAQRMALYANQPAANATLSKVGWGLVVVIALAGTAVCATALVHILGDYPIRIADSDILPALSIYPKRLLAGQTVYTPFTEELGYHSLPTYLPGTWGPYVVAELLHIDYRWLAFALLIVVGFGAYVKTLLTMRLPTATTLGLLAWPFVLLYSLMKTAPSTFGHTVEGMICGYYLVLLAGVLLSSRWLRVAGLILCLLSRYSLIFWVPLYLGLLFFQKSRREAIITAALVSIAVLALYVVPFLSHDWGMFFRVQASYVDAALGEWNHLNAAGLPYHLYNGVGMGNFFYHFGSGSLAQRLHTLQITHLLLLLLTIAGAAWFYTQQARANRLDYRIYVIIILKIYLIFFYSFIQVPYVYLATVSLFTSLFMLLLAVIQPADLAYATAGSDSGFVGQPA